MYGSTEIKYCVLVLQRHQNLKVHKYVTYPSLSILQGFKYMYDAGNMPCKKTCTNEWYIMFLKMEKQF
jgi:hypothetical protein